MSIYPAKWDLHGKSAGPIRNQQMLDTGVDLVIAFPGGKGTAHMVSIAKKAGVKVVEIDV
jgi:UDP-N-acetylmuramoylalanine-D-glutamate ligase